MKLSKATKGFLTLALIVVFVLFSAGLLLSDADLPMKLILEGVLVGICAGIFAALINEGWSDG